MIWQGKSLHLRRAVLPVGVFLGVIIVHYLWSGFFPEHNPAQDRWAASPGAELSWWRSYIETKGYWLGYSYALSIAFAAVALRRYRENRFCKALNIAIGGVTFSGFLAAASCFLAGCCGSPHVGCLSEPLRGFVSPFGKAPVSRLYHLLHLGGLVLDEPPHPLG